MYLHDRCEAALHTVADDSLENHGGVLAGVRRTIHHTVKRFPQIKTFAKYIGLAAGALAMTAAMFTGVGELAVAAYAVGGLATTLDTALAISGDGKVSTAAWDARLFSASESRESSPVASAYFNDWRATSRAFEMSSRS